MALALHVSLTPPPLPPALPLLGHLPNPNLHPPTKLRASNKQIHRPSSPQGLVSLTTSIIAHCRNGHLSAAASTFATFLGAGLLPNPVTIVTFLSACSDDPSPFSLSLGSSIHALLIKSYPFHIREDVFLGTALVDLYAKCAVIVKARRVFDEMVRKNSVTWNTMIDGYMRRDDADEAVALFQRMTRRDKVSWTTLIDGFVKSGRYEDALVCFQDMQIDGVEVDYVTIITAVSACADLGLLGHGMWLHCYAEKRGIERHVRLSNSFIDMYFRCGCVEFARQLFAKMPKRTRVSWNSMIVGFAMNGLAEDTFEHFARMQEQGFEPDGVSFTGALTACSHAGMVEEGLRYYDVMKRVHGITPSIEHYGCIVDLLSRAGRLEDAMELVENMPMRANDVVLGSLLAACRAHGDMKLGEKIMGHLVELEPECDSTYVLLSNIYAASGKWDNVGRVRSTMKSLGINKEPGFSVVEVDGGVHEFVAGDKSHCYSEDLYRTLEILGREMKTCDHLDQTVLEDSLYHF